MPTQNQRNFATEYNLGLTDEDDDARWNMFISAAQADEFYRVQSGEPAAIEELEVPDLSEEQLFKPRIEPVPSKKMHEAIEARVEEQVNRFGVSEQEAREKAVRVATVPRTSEGELPHLNIALDKAFGKREEDKTEEELMMERGYGGPSIVLALAATAIAKATNFDEIPSSNWGKFFRSLAPLQEQSPEDYAAYKVQERKAATMALDQFNYEGIDTSNLDEAGIAKLRKRTKLIMEGAIPAVANAQDSFDMSEEEVIKMFQSQPDWADDLSAGVEWLTTTDLKGRGKMESLPVWASRVVMAPVSGLVGATEAAVTDKGMEAVSERVSGGMGMTGAGIDLGDGAADLMGLEEDSPFRTAMVWTGGGIGLAFDLAIPIDVGVISTGAKMVSSGAQTAKATRIAGLHSPALQGTKAAGRELGIALTKGALTPVAAARIATVPPRQIVKKLYGSVKAPFTSAEGSVGGKILTELLEKNPLMDTFKMTALEQRILNKAGAKLGIEADVLVSTAHKFVGRPQNQDRAGDVWNFQSEFLANAKKGSTPKSFYNSNGYAEKFGKTFEEFSLSAKQGGFKVDTIEDIAKFGKEAEETLNVALLDVGLTSEAKAQILLRGVGTNEWVSTTRAYYNSNPKALTALYKEAREGDVGAQQLIEYLYKTKKGSRPNIKVISDTDDAINAAVKKTYAGRGVTKLFEEAQATGKLGIEKKIKYGDRFLSEKQAKDVKEELSNSPFKKLQEKIIANKAAIKVEDDVVSFQLSKEDVVLLEGETSKLAFGQDILDKPRLGEELSEVIKQIDKARAEGTGIVIKASDWNKIAIAKTENAVASKMGARTSEEIASFLKSIDDVGIKNKVINRILTPNGMRHGMIGEGVKGIALQAKSAVKGTSAGIPDPIIEPLMESILSKIGSMGERNQILLRQLRADGMTIQEAGAHLIAKEIYKGDADLLLNDFTNLLYGGTEIEQLSIQLKRANNAISYSDINSFTKVILRTQKGTQVKFALQQALSRGDNIEALTILKAWQQELSGKAVIDVAGLSKAELTAAYELVKADEALLKTTEGFRPLLSGEGRISSILAQGDAYAPLYISNKGNDIIHIIALQRQKANIIDTALIEAAAKYPEIFPSKKWLSAKADDWIADLRVEKATRVEAPPVAVATPTKLPPLDRAGFDEFFSINSGQGMSAALLDDIVVEAKSLMASTGKGWDDVLEEAATTTIAKARAKIADETTDRMMKMFLGDLEQNPQLAKGILGKGEPEWGTPSTPSIIKWWDDVGKEVTGGTGAAKVRAEIDANLAPLRAQSTKERGIPSETLIVDLSVIKERLWSASVLDRISSQRGLEADSFGKIVKEYFKLAYPNDKEVAASVRTLLSDEGVLAVSMRPGADYIASQDLVRASHEVAQQKRAFILSASEGKGYETVGPVEKLKTLGLGTEDASAQFDLLGRNKKAGITGVKDTLANIRIKPKYRTAGDVRPTKDLREPSRRNRRGALPTGLPQQKLRRPLAEGVTKEQNITLAREEATSGIAPPYGIEPWRYANRGVYESQLVGVNSLDRAWLEVILPWSKEPIPPLNVRIKGTDVNKLQPALTKKPTGPPRAVRTETINVLEGAIGMYPKTVEQFFDRIVTQALMNSGAATKAGAGGWEAEALRLMGLKREGDILVIIPKSPRSRYLPATDSIAEATGRWFGKYDPKKAGDEVLGNIDYRGEFIKFVQNRLTKRGLKGDFYLTNDDLAKIARDGYARTDLGIAKANLEKIRAQEAAARKGFISDEGGGMDFLPNIRPNVEKIAEKTTDIFEGNVNRVLDIVDDIALKDVKLSDQLLNMIWDGASMVNNTAKSGMLSGAYFLSSKFNVNNASTMSMIGYSTIGDIGVKGAASMGKGARVVAYNNPMPMVGKPSASEIIATTPSGQVYTLGQIADIVRDNGLARSMASAELTQSVLGDFMAHTRLHVKSGDGKLMAYLDRNFNVMKRNNVFGRVANEVDNTYRSGVLIAGLEDGRPLADAITLSRSSLFDYSKNMGALHKHIWFLTFAYNNTKTFYKMALSNPSKIKNILLVNRGFPEYDEQQKEWKKRISSRGYAETRMLGPLSTKENVPEKQRTQTVLPSAVSIEPMVRMFEILGVLATMTTSRDYTYDTNAEVVKKFLNMGADMANPHYQFIASQTFGFDMRKGIDRKLSGVMDGYFMMKLQQDPEAWEAAVEYYNLQPVTTNKEYPGGSTYQGRQWKIVGDIGKKRWYRTKYAMIMSGRERLMRERIYPDLFQATGVLDEYRDRGDIVDDRMDRNWMESLGITTRISAPTDEEQRRTNIRKGYYDVLPER